MAPLTRKMRSVLIAALIGIPAATLFAAPPPPDCSACGCPDCNNNGVDDRCDVSCSNGGVFCQGGSPVNATCNSGYFPACGSSADCNGNDTPDGCDLASGASCDANLNGVPDECEYQIPGNVRLVDDNAPLGGDGLTWCTAFRSLQDALAAATAGKTLRVAQGTYHPVDCAPSCGPADRTATFNLKNGVTIQGGYAGLGAPVPNARNVSANETILSGDLLGNDMGFTNSVENAFHVVTAVSVDATAVLDGLTIRGGHADGSGNDKLGAGMLVGTPNPLMLELGGTPTIVNCKFTNNISSQDDGSACGGGLYSGFSAPTLDNCVFSNNVSTKGGGIFIFDRHGTSSPKLTNCTFIANSALRITTAFGGGAYVKSSWPAFTNCKFLGNWSDEGGGGLCNAEVSKTRLVNCLFSGNMAYVGGGVGNRINSDGKVINCSFSNNVANVDGGNFYTNSSAPTVSNSIFSGGEVTSIGQPKPTITFSLVGGVPRFVNALGADGVAGTEDDDLRLNGGSPAIDAGSNDPLSGDTCTQNSECEDAFQTCANGTCVGSVFVTDLAANPRIVDGGCGATTDIGALEVQMNCGNGVCDPGETTCTCPGECAQFVVAATEDPASTCHDGWDNDCDCLLDCADVDCQNMIPENCGDHVDNDCDGQTDCADSDCAGAPQCPGGIE